MEIRNLRTFVSVAEHNSFTKAAAVLGYAQSTVSFQIKQLETELDGLLFERINHTLLLTDLGRELLGYAQEVCQLTEAFHQERQGEADIRGSIRIVTPDSVCEAMMLENYNDFYQHYPNIQLKFSTGDTEDMFRILDHNEADVMMTLDEHVYQHDYVIAKEVRMGTHFVAGKSFPLAGKKNLSIRDLLDSPMLLTEKGMGYRRILDDTLARRSIELQPVLEIGRTDIIAEVLRAGVASSFLPDFVTRSRVESGDLVYLDVTDVEIDIWQQLIYHRNKWISKTLEAFIQYVCEHEFSR